MSANGEKRLPKSPGGDSSDLFGAEFLGSPCHHRRVFSFVYSYIFIFIFILYLHGAIGVLYVRYFLSNTTYVHLLSVLSTFLF